MTFNFASIQGGRLPRAYRGDPRTLRPGPTRTIMRAMVSDLLKDELPDKLADHGAWVRAVQEPWRSNSERFLAVLEGMLLAEVRQDREFQQDRTKRAATLWCSLVDRTHLKAGERDAHHRWHLGFANWPDRLEPSHAVQ